MTAISKWALVTLPWALLSTACGDDATSAIDLAGDAQVDRDAGVSDSATAPDLSLAFGANLEPGGAVFRVWAPNATAAQVTGNFAASPAVMQLGAGGVFEAHVSGVSAGATYKYALETPIGSVSRLDPYCRELQGGDCVVIDPSTYAWQTTSFTRPARTEAVVYEMHVGSFAVPAGASNGTFASAKEALSTLADLGINVVELMPVQAFGGGNASWGYNPQLWLAPKPSYGTADDLRAFVDRAHALGIAVWIDTVVNHADGYSKAPLRCFDGACEGNAGIYFFAPGDYEATPWGPRPNYLESQVAAMFVSSVDTWLDEMRGDGMRWDSVSNIRAIDGSGTVPGGRELLLAANTHLHDRGAFSVAEDLKGYDAITRDGSSGGFGFDAQWDGFAYQVSGVLTAASDADRDLGGVVAGLTTTTGGDPWTRLLYLETHDTAGNGGSRLPKRIDGANPTSWSARRRSLLAAALLFTAPGVPMFFQGTEALAITSFADPPMPLEAPTAQGLEVRAFYKDLIRLRRNLDGGAAALQGSGVEILHRNDVDKVLAYRRTNATGEEAIVVLNLKNTAYTEYDIGVADGGAWRIRLTTDSTKYGSDFTAGPTGMVTPKAGAKDGRPFTLPLVLGAYGALVLTR